MTREELQHDFHNEQGINWLNSQGEPDIDYVMWLENKILAIKNNTPLPPAEDAEEILKKKWTEVYLNEPFGYEYSAFKSQRYDEWVIAAMTEFATLHAQQMAEKMVEEKLPNNKKIHEAALAWAKEHSNAPDKDCPDWLIRDYEAGAYFVRQCMGCWNKE